MTRSLCRRTMGVSLRGGADISRFKVTSENSYQGIEFPWKSPLPRAIIRAADNENLFSPLPRGACETSQPFLHPPPFLFVRISPPRTPPPLPLPSSIFTRLIDSSDACIIEHSFSLFRSASVQPKFSLAITANRILFAIIASVTSRVFLIEFHHRRVSLEEFLGNGTPRCLLPFRRGGYILLGSEGEQEGPPPSSCVHTPGKFERKFGRVFPGNWIREGTILSREGGGSLVRDENT